jgi:cytochrome c
MRTTILALILAAATTSHVTAAPKGEQLYRLQCKGCHAPDGTGLGPSLMGVFGAKIGAKPNFTYSPALVQRQQDTWTEATLEAFLAEPDAFAPGTNMPKPQGLLTVADRAAVIQYLATLK